MSVKVAVRCRPFSEDEYAVKSESAISMETDGVVKVNYGHHHHSFFYDETLCSVQNAKKQAFQETVYEAVAAPLLGHVLGGYNGCIFAYGQTGSGKTYSMTGTAEERGVIPRIVENLFCELPVLEKGGVETCVEVSFFEIYNEKVRCLLRPSENGFDDTSLRVREHPKFGPFIEGLAKFVVTTKEECLRLLEDGTKVRSTASTAMNSVSSRSHAVFTITLTQNKKSGVLVINTTSKLNLVDLAGSERASRTQASGQRLIEGSTINKSLSVLGKVISGLAETSEQNKARHIPYRDSTLTWILKDNLGGNSKTVMLATISPAAIQLEETMSTLRYAERAKKIVNKAIVNESNNNEVIAALQKEIEALTTALKNATQIDRAALTEEIVATEAIKRELNRTMEEKVAETKMMMASRDHYMKELESRLALQNDEIEMLKQANAEKERRILELLDSISKGGTGGGSASELELMRIRVAQLEREQHNAVASFQKKELPSLFMEQKESNSFNDDVDLSLEGSMLSFHSSDIVLDSTEVESGGVDSELDRVFDSGEVDPLPPSQHVDPCRALPSDDSNVDLDIDLGDSDSIHLSADQSIVLSSRASQRNDENPGDIIDLADWETEVVDISKSSSPEAPTKNDPVAETSSPPAPTVAPSDASISSFQCTSDAMDNNAFFVYLSPVFLTFGSLKYGSCLLECNLFEKKIAILTVHGKDIDTYPSTRLQDLQVDESDSKILYISFFEETKIYTCEFLSAVQRSLMYQVLLLCRGGVIMCCPSLCKSYEANGLNLVVRGTTVTRDNAVIHVRGDAHLKVAKLPYEVYGFWYGCFAVESGTVPTNPALLYGFLPDEARDIYIIGVLNLPHDKIHGSEINKLFLKCLGEDSYHVAGSGFSSSSSDCSCFLTVICRNFLAARVGKAVFRSPKSVNDVYEGVACRISVNESSLVVLLVNGKNRKGISSKNRNASLRSLITNIDLGDASADASTRFDYFIVSGKFSYRHPFEAKDSLLEHMKINNALSDFTELVPSKTLRSVADPSRIFIFVQPHGARMQLSEYSTTRALPHSSYVVGDLYSRRPFLNLFSGISESYSLLISDVVFRTKRMPSSVKITEIHFSGSIVRHYPQIYPLPATDDVGECLITEPVEIPLSENCADSIHCLSVRLSVYGTTSSLEAPFIIASSVIPCKNALKHQGQPFSFKVSAYRSSCFLGSIKGRICLAIRNVSSEKNDECA